MEILHLLPDSRSDFPSLTIVPFPEDPRSYLRGNSMRVSTLECLYKGMRSITNDNIRPRDGFAGRSVDRTNRKRLDDCV